MAFEPQIKSIELKNKRSLESQKTQVVLNFQTNGQKIEKVLYAKSEICVGNVVQNISSANVNGNVETCVIVQTEDGIVSLSSSSPLNVTFNSNLITQDSFVWAEILNLGIENVVVNEISLSLTQKMSVNVFVLEKQMQNYVESIYPANQKMEMYEFDTIQNVLSENFETNFELEFPSLCSKILGAESFAVMESVDTSKDIVVTKGTLYTNLLYLSADETPKLRNKIYTNEFSHEFLLSGTDETQKGFAKFFVCKTNFEVDGEMNKDKGLISLSTKLRASILLQSQIKFEAVVDAFCPRKELQMDFSSFASQSVVLNKVFSDKIDGFFHLKEPDFIDKILFVAPNFVEVSTTQVEGNEITLKGRASVWLSFALDNEELATKTEQVVIPFEVVTKSDEKMDDDKIFVSVFQSNVEARLKKSKEVEITTELIFQICVVKEKSEAIMSGLTTGEERKQNFPNMGIYIIDKADDLWEVSKKLLINPKILEEQNPGISFPITEPTQIIVYRERIN